MIEEILSITRANGAARIRFVSGGETRLPSCLLGAYPLRLRAGQALDTDAFSAFVREKELAFALERTLKMQSMREHTEKEIAAALRRSAYSENAVSRALEMTRGAGLVSDARFASVWTAHRAKSYGRRRIDMEMRQKGVDAAHAREALEEFSRDEETLAASRRAEKLLRQGRDEQKILQALARRGYDWPVCRRALEDAKKSME